MADDPKRSKRRHESDESPDPFEGTNYRRLRRLLGRSMTEIYEVEGPQGRAIAKILRPEYLSNRAFVDHLRLEADILAAARHPNVVRFFEAGRTGQGRPYLVLEALVGRSLRREVRKHGPIPPLVAAELLVQALDGLGSIHQLGLIHRDLKPDNLFLHREQDGHHILKILDFGSAKVAGPSKIQPIAISTTEGKFRGTRRYAAPEQIRIGRTVDLRADIYALGLVLYAMLFGRDPFHDIDSQRGLLRAHAEEPLEPPSSATGGSVPLGLLRIIERATQKSPDDRYQDTTTFAEALHEFIRNGAEPAPPSGQPSRKLTVREHARMTAEIEREPEKTEEIRARYGITSPRHLAVAEAWFQQHIGSKPAALENWRSLVEIFAAKLPKRQP